jgi:hypothetical protein
MYNREIPSPRELVRHAYQRVEAERDQLFRIAVLPIFIYFLIFVFVQPQEQNLPAVLLVVVLAFVPETLFDVAWLRRLLGADGGDPPLPYRWTARHTGFIGRLAALHLMLIAVAIPVVIVASVLPQSLGFAFQFICIPLFFYISLRISLFLVARALDHDCDLRRSWEATRDGIWRFFWGVAFTVLPLMILVIMILELMIAIGIAKALPLVMILVTTAAAFLLRALLLVVIARIYEVRMIGRVSY